MKIKISERELLNDEGKREIAVKSSKSCLQISSGYDCLATGHITFDPDLLPELIDVLQTFLTERGAA